MTNAEQMLWEMLRKERLGAKFRKQHPVGGYIADFACLEHKLIVDLDGSQHAEEKNIKKDEKRTEFLESQGFKVIRFWNNELFENTEGVIETIYKTLNAEKKCPHPNPPPNGEGTGGDDYAMLREVFTRRFKRLKDEPENTPDLVLIDGGLGQVSSAKQVFDELEISHIKYVGIAKGVDRNAGREWFFIDGKTPFQLPENDPTLHYLQRLRDEAHRFAIGAHRDKRSKTMKVSELDLITGIGASRKKALLHHFGSARAVAAASISEIGQVAGISEAVAKKIYQHFHGA
jgi:very-short-patch-repair endonuclease